MRKKSRCELLRTSVMTKFREFTFADVGCIEPKPRQRYHDGAPACEGMNHMEAARTTEVVIGATSSHSFVDAIAAGVSRATATLRGVEGVRIKDMNVMIEDGNITGYKVNLEVTFVLEDERESGVVVDPEEYSRLQEAAEELEDLRAYDEAIMELETGKDELTPWALAKGRVAAEREDLRRRGEL
jgi:dodecin